jgi:cytochrome P450
MTTTDSQTEGASTDLDHHSEYFRENNYAIYSEFRERCPVLHSTAWDGFWLFLGYDAIVDAAQDAELFGSGVEKAVPPLSPDPLIPIDIDPPLHGAYRRIVLPRFSPGAAERWRPRIRQLATELVDDFIESGRADIVQQLTTPLPARWILQMLGLDDSRWSEWVHWIHSTIHDRTHDPERAGIGVTNIYGSIIAAMEDRRANGFGDDLISIILQAEVEGAPLTDEQVIGYVFLLMLGGMDTTSGLTGNALVRLDEDPALRQQLIDDPGLLGPATEEFLRHDTPTQGLYRLVKRDCEFHGQQLRAGDRVTLMFASGNRDPKVFNEPEEIDLTRSPNRHLAFSLGPHRCLGSNFARVMFQEMIAEVLERIPDFAIDGEVVRFEDAGDVYAVRHLPIRFTPGPRLGSRLGS